MANLKQQFVIGETYKIKLTYKARAITKTFEGFYNPTGEQNEAYKFDGVGGTLFITDEHIEKFEVAKAKKVKAKQLKTCDRCGGIGTLEHLRHVENGICYKCGGTGKIN